MSEQDFFFDEEPAQAPEEPKAPKAPRAPKSAPSAPAPAKRAAAEPVTESYDPQMTTWSVAVLLALVGLLLGAILGFLLGSSLAKPATTTSAAPATTQTSSTGAGALTTDQVQAGLPAGHPAINTTSTETTGN